MRGDVKKKNALELESNFAFLYSVDRREVSLEDKKGRRKKGKIK